ncbi:MAG: sodium-independent anion transporter [Roseiflexus castenholzii]|uniref:SulP family inorganic anion transporter n=1 Tax=Roseiflexus castenholzii TaxID=120962 RepID=UPI000CA65BDC|nr:MAG: sodium-independent anion transporter [Roseiflexus castenholzii]
MAVSSSLKTPLTGQGLRRYFPFLDWLLHYRRSDLPNDLVAGLVTAIMLIPQSMAYAQLAGLPPQVGLYASVAPLAIYALLGTSGQLSVGPVAITSLAVFAGVSALAEPGSSRYLELVLLLAFIVGLVKLLLGLLRLGFVMNFVSHPVLAGFTSASALIIAAGQLKYLLGYRIEGEHVHEIVLNAVAGVNQTNPATLAIGAISIALLILFRSQLKPLLQQRTRLPAAAVTLIVSGAPLVTVLLGILVSWFWRLNETAGVRVVGAIPQGFAPFTLPTLSAADAQALLPTAMTIVFISVVESIAVAKALASKRRKAINADQELVALGAANLTASVTGGYPVTGGFARSVVNDQAGAVTGLASLVTAASIGIIVLWFTPLFYYLPQAVLAATVIVAVLSLFKPGEALRIWRMNRTDAVTWGVTFAVVLLFGIEAGILAGVVFAILLFLWRTSRPHIAIVGRVGQSEHFRNVLRHQVQTCPHVVAVRVDESLYFANTRYLEDALLRIVAERPEVKHLVLIGSAINFIDASAMETLESLLHELRAAGVALHLADIKGPVMDQLQRAGFIDHLGAERVYLSTHQAMRALECV